MGSGDGLCPPQLGVWGLPPEKKNQFCAKKLSNSEQVFGTSFLHYSIRTFSMQKLLPAHQRKWGGLSLPVLKVGGPIPCPPCSDAYVWEQLLVPISALLSCSPRDCYICVIRNFRSNKSIPQFAITINSNVCPHIRVPNMLMRNRMHDVIGIFNREARY